MPSKVLTRDSIWTTQDRERVAVKDMSDHHLLCTIRVLRGRSPHGTTWRGRRQAEWIEVMKREAFERGLLPAPGPLPLRRRLTE